MTSASPLWNLPNRFRIDTSWFDHHSDIHGKGHTIRVMILADCLYRRAIEECLPATEPLYRNLMTAALIHDLARRHDGLCREHGKWARDTKRPIAEKYFLGFNLPENEWTAIGEAVEAHSRRDPPVPYPQGSLTALLKDADGLDRIRLGISPNPAYFRHLFTASYLDLAWNLLAHNEDDLEREFFRRRSISVLP